MAIPTKVARSKKYKENIPVAIQSAISNAQNNKSPKTFQAEEKEHSYLREDKTSTAMLRHIEKSMTDF